VSRNFNDKFTGKETPINSMVDTLYPTISMDGNATVEVNFGENLAKPFSYDIKKCPGMVLE
jgi:hypothetical protein